MTARELERLAEELGIDAVGATPAAAYDGTEAHIADRRARGLFADLRFTMAQPEVSCHPETLLPGARTVVSAALCYYAPGPEPAPGEGRMPRYTWRDAYAELRDRLDAFGKRLGGDYRVLVDANQHVDREAAARSGVGFYGKNTMLITRRHGSWVVLGTLVTTEALEPTPPLDLDCGSCRLCIDACPTGALDDPGTLDANRCLSYWTQSKHSIPEPYRLALEDRVYGCDICQDVCPWNRGIEKRRAADGTHADAEPTVSLVDWLEAEDADLRVRYERLFVPRNDSRFLRRNAIVAAGNNGTDEHRAVLERYADSDDPLLAEHAEWALDRLTERQNPTGVSARTSREQSISKTEVWTAWVRLAAFAFAVVEVALLGRNWPVSHESLAWVVTALFGAGSLVLLVLAYRAPRGAWRRIGFAALALDTAAVYAYVAIYAFEPGAGVRQLVYIPVVEAALRFGLAGGLTMPVLSAALLGLIEWRREDPFPPAGFEFERITFPIAIQAILGLVIGSLVDGLRAERRAARGRVADAEALRDELGRRADLLDATNRCARALSSSLEINQAFAAFIRELAGLVRFERTAILLVEDGHLRVFATAGEAAETVFPPGTVTPIAGSAMTEVRNGHVLYREDMLERRFNEETEFNELGLRSRVLVPLLSGPETIGALSVVRREPSAFAPDEIELLRVLGRLAGSAVQNIRAYELERTTAEELRRLSALRADFVSLVSHELRSPMASVIGSARTLELRWRELSPEQRESFLALIAHETSRLAELISDVLDTSRIEAGTFSYSFEDVDLAAVIRDTAAAAAQAQDEVTVEAKVREPLPKIRGDKDRLRQVLVNLVDNAVKYSSPGDTVKVEAHTLNGHVVIEVHDRGPGIPPQHHTVIFEKFGRVHGETAKPGTGLGLFIARSIAEAHGGSLAVSSNPEQQGATFTLSLPV